MAADDVTLREITKDTVRAICDLEVAPEQARFVTSNGVSIAEAYFQPHAWFRAIYAGEEPVGFLMLYDVPGDDGRAPKYLLWRLMIARDHQGKGYGRDALDRLVEHVRLRPGAVRLETSCVPASEGGPEAFYREYGFSPTGALNHGQIVLELPL